MYRKVSILAFAALVLFATVGASECDDTENQTLQDQRKESIEFRATSFARAEEVAPAPRTENFPMRQALVDYTERQDLLNHPWYIYIFSDNGAQIGYFVGKTYPQSTCNFLSSTEEFYKDSNGVSAVLTAPSLDGVFYGGGGSSGGGCDYFFFDAATNAMQVISNRWKWFTSDAPLKLDVKPIEVVTR